jgi:hypothetical protein
MASTDSKMYAAEQHDEPQGTEQRKIPNSDSRSQCLLYL